MASLFEGTDNVISKFLVVNRKALRNKTTCVKPLNDQESFALISEMYEILESNYRKVGSKPRSTSEEFWRCEPVTSINIDGKKNESDEKILEKAVGVLAGKRHMPGWFNQCPVAAGISDPRKDNKRAVDLVHWSKSDSRMRLIELKWKSDSPLYALFEVLEYGLAYIFCRIHQKELPLQCPSLMDVRRLSLEVVAPRQFYARHDKKDFFAQMCKSLNEFASSKINGLSMSLDALAFAKDFPAEFERMFENGDDVKQNCDTQQLTSEGQTVRDAFTNLVQVWPQS